MRNEISKFAVRPKVTCLSSQKSRKLTALTRPQRPSPSSLRIRKNTSSTRHLMGSRLLMPLDERLRPARRHVQLPVRSQCLEPLDFQLQFLAVSSLIEVLTVAFPPLSLVARRLPCVVLRSLLVHRPCIAVGSRSAPARRRLAAFFSPVTTAGFVTEGASVGPVPLMRASRRSSCGGSDIFIHKFADK